MDITQEERKRQTLAAIRHVQADQSLSPESSVRTDAVQDKLVDLGYSNGDDHAKRMQELVENGLAIMTVRPTEAGNALGAPTIKDEPEVDIATTKPEETKTETQPTE